MWQGKLHWATGFYFITRYLPIVSPIYNIMAVHMDNRQSSVGFCDYVVQAVLKLIKCA
jgi:hypothetical protein